MCIKKNNKEKKSSQVGCKCWWLPILLVFWDLSHCFKKHLTYLYIDITWYTLVSSSGEYRVASSLPLLSGLRIISMCQIDLLETICI